jgi:hypothetical protein
MGRSEVGSSDAESGESLWSAHIKAFTQRTEPLGVFGDPMQRAFVGTNLSSRLGTSPRDRQLGDATLPLNRGQNP